jgi:hypothetical protein
MEWAAPSHYVPEAVIQKHGRLNVSDWDLVRHLLARDGVLPARAPSHKPRGLCKYARFYPGGGCPWCRAKAA